ncbi:MAG: cellulase family glycosylhydrolase [Deltaproteobacteria bacterium]|nr:cellulase family glycosylhydrolase [Deltaproteobacteria bacterium]
MPLAAASRSALLVCFAGVALALAACVPGVPPAPGADASRFRLPALHAVPDPVAGGRIVDARGREVLLRGVNVNAFVDYWAYSPSLFVAYPFTEEDADRIAAIGWNCVRLLLSWSRVEPQPGVYDDAYLAQLEQAVLALQRRGIYTVIDLHQDAWGPTLFAREGEICPPASTPAFGWDGAPGWATLDGGQPHCVQGGQREFSLAVREAFAAFWRNDPGPGGVGIRTRYARMLGHVAGFFARHDAVAGYEIMNEPNAIWLFPGQLEGLAALYAESIVEIRAAEAAAGAPRRLVFFEPAITWHDFGPGAPPPFAHDDQVVYAPHLYQGGISPVPLGPEVFERARGDAALYGGAPIYTSEWGGSPARAADPADDYFDRHQALQDEYRFGAALWTWREACGDPHMAATARKGDVPAVWGFFDVDCATNVVSGAREAFVRRMTRPYLRAAPGPIGRVTSDPSTGVLEASGTGARPWASFIVFVPAAPGGRAPRVEMPGAHWLHVVPGPGGASFVVGYAAGGDWSLRIETR